MNKLKTHIIAIVLVALVIIGSAFYLLSQNKSQAPTEQEQETTVQQPEEKEVPLQEEATTPTTEESTVSKPQEEQPKEQPLSEEELTALWANGERCPRERFSAHEPASVLPEYEEPYLNFIQVYFTDDATCEDVERIAILLDAKITGGYALSITHIYQLNLDTTIEDLEETIIKIEELDDPKIKSVEKVIRLDWSNWFGL